MAAFMTRNFYRAAAASRRRSLAGFRKEKGTNEMIEALGTKTRKLFVAKNSCIEFLCPGTNVVNYLAVTERRIF